MFASTVELPLPYRPILPKATEESETFAGRFESPFPYFEDPLRSYLFSFIRARYFLVHPYCAFILPSRQEKKKFSHLRFFLGFSPPTFSDLSPLEFFLRRWSQLCNIIQIYPRFFVKFSSIRNRITFFAPPPSF